ncbi:hypothetical protein K469DRAFT_689836 [Zopfia rhizophila CBS 207.26]|uniref:Uncharacterized protein n=1 Tax=Zopfia rhizophila CBS 207.26 TaxID=1314779 RepID=A0A6A6DZ81_9PEZI|nr:hypothetical protein K469DRAFT_689836 [Zopfia rhizophila CBS 207.26]
MPRKKSPEAFFERGRDNGSEEKKGTVGGEEVQKTLQPKMELNYQRNLALCYHYETLHPGASPRDIKASKDFVRSLALGIEGSYGIDDPGMWTVVQYYKDFTAA